MVNGERCSKCCEVLTIKESKNFREWRSYVRRNGYPDDFKSDRIYDMLRPISKRRAKKINPHLVKKLSSSQGLWTCKHHSEKGCGIYENRPEKMCGEYPHYGRTIEEWEKSPEFKNSGLYSEDCTYFIEVKNHEGE